MLRKYILAKAILTVILSVSCYSGYSQNYMVLNQWRLMRNEISFSGGASNFLGDLGGRDMIGSNFIYDMEKSLFKTMFGVNYRYYLSRNLIFRQGFNYQKVEGDDKLTAEKFRNNRNLHFRSNIFQFNTLLEFQLSTTSDSRRHNLRNNRGRRIGWKYRSFGIYGFTGIGVFYFNPKANYQGRWVNLIDLHTEGQGLPDGPDQYKRISLAIPVGGGFRVSITKQVALSLEIAHNFTFTDYIDDVSTVYYDNEAINTQYGSMAAYLANPSLGSLNQHLGYDPTTPGYQRGDETDKDGYFYGSIGIHYRFRNAYQPPSGSMKFRKRQKIRTIF